MEEDTKYKINDKIGVEIPKNMESLTFQGFFTFLRKSLQIKYKKFLNFTIKDLYTKFKFNPYSMEVILLKDFCLKGKENYFKYIYIYQK